MNPHRVGPIQGYQARVDVGRLGEDRQGVDVMSRYLDNNIPIEDTKDGLSSRLVGDEATAAATNTWTIGSAKTGASQSRATSRSEKMKFLESTSKDNKAFPNRNYQLYQKGLTR